MDSRARGARNGIPWSGLVWNVKVCGIVPSRARLRDGWPQRWSSPINRCFSLPSLSLIQPLPHHPSLHSSLFHSFYRTFHSLLPPGGGPITSFFHSLTVCIIHPAFLNFPHSFDSEASPSVHFFYLHHDAQVAPPLRCHPGPVRQPGLSSRCHRPCLGRPGKRCSERRPAAQQQQPLWQCEHRQRHRYLQGCHCRCFRSLHCGHPELQRVSLNTLLRRGHPILLLPDDTELTTCVTKVVVMALAKSP